MMIPITRDDSDMEEGAGVVYNGESWDSFMIWFFQVIVIYL